MNSRADRIAPLPEEGPRIAAFGGGTGMSCLLRGLKPFTPSLTAIVTVTDNGGSSGRLRKEFDMVPPGDIRNCLLALSEREPLLKRLFEYRFEESVLEGHNFGNIFITALTRVMGSFDLAVRELNGMLNVRGKVLPATDRKVSLIAHHPDGTKSTGEVQIARAGKAIAHVEMRPRVGAIADDIVEAIRGAELMVFGPGSLFTSVVPNLLVERIREEIAANRCEKIYVANIMTQPGETTGLSLLEHVRALEKYGGGGLITAVVAHAGEIPAEMLERYVREGAHPVEGLEELTTCGNYKVVTGDLLDREASSIRHQPDALGQLIADQFLSAPARKTA